MHCLNVLWFMKQLDLFSSTTSPKLSINNAEVYYYKDFLSQSMSDKFLSAFINEIKWQQKKIKIFNREIDQPRLTAWYGDHGTNYSYSGIDLIPETWIPALLELKMMIEKFIDQHNTDIAHTIFNSVLLNFYRNERDSMSWHADDEPELLNTPVIASISLGAVRRFQFRNKYDHKIKYSLELEHGSLLLMKGETQLNWQHQLPKYSRPISPRINLTYRVVEPIK